MALPSAPASISLAQIQTEFGGSNPISLSEYYKGGGLVTNDDTAPNVPSSGQISMSNFRGAVKYTGPTTVEYLVVAGGGGGATGQGSVSAAAGGGGGYKTATNKSVSKSTTYTVTVGAGAGRVPGGNGEGAKGASSVFDNVQTTGGGGGGQYASAGQSGGSGGGGGGYFASEPGGAGTPGEGNNGGDGLAGGGCGGGGGGGGAAGGNAANPGNPQVFCNFASGGSGASVFGQTWAGGGGVGANRSVISWQVYPYAGGSGGSGGGGNGGGMSINSNDPFCAAQTGGVNTGGGGGSTGMPCAPVDSPTTGGSGVVIVRYPSTFGDATTTGSPTYTNSGGYKTYKFTGSGSIRWD